MGAHLTLAVFQVSLPAWPCTAHSNSQKGGLAQSLAQGPAHPGQLLFCDWDSTPGPDQRHGYLVPCSLNETRASFTSVFWVQIA